VRSTPRLQGAGRQLADRSRQQAAELAAGREFFRDRCARCHTLADAGAGGTRGPNLDEIRLPAFAVSQQIKLGGGGMPAYAGRLADEQIRRVAGYIVARRAVGPG
jgi:mono/diheme cytochrome c family protein